MRVREERSGSREMAEAVHGLIEARTGPLAERVEALERAVRVLIGRVENPYTRERALEELKRRG